ncbi:MAG: hypothetical protein DCC51_03800 [Anaerolineae bacterium]|nr:MAG: hypothetical protein DCC51_03800 [Anaerolineae bacterium]
MRPTICGVLTDYKGRILLRRADPRTLLPIYRLFEVGKLPAETLARAFREDTGLFVMPVRLTSLDYSAAQDELTATFRCTMRGGDLAPQEEPTVGFFDPPPPAALSKEFRSRVELALRHAGGPPQLQVDGKGVFSRIFGGRKDQGDKRRLPAGSPARGEAPWQVAERLLQAHLPGGSATAIRLVAGVSSAGRPALDLIFAADVTSEALPSLEKASFALPELGPDFATADVTLLRSIDWTTDACQWLIDGE